MSILKEKENYICGSRVFHFLVDIAKHQKGGEKASHNVGYVLLKLPVDFFFSILTRTFSSFLVFGFVLHH
jgi:hypothetical protein